MRFETLAEEWFSEASNGRMVNTTEPTPNWIRLPHPMEYYEARTHWEWVIDAIHAADVSVDFTQFDLVHIVVPKNSFANATNSFTTSYAEQSGGGVPVDGVEVRHGATDINSYNILVHEIGHLFGLPDLGSANPKNVLGEHVASRRLGPDESPICNPPSPLLGLA